MTLYHDKFLNWTIYRKLQALYDNYERDIDLPENHTHAHFLEEKDYINTIYDTPPIKILKTFLTCKGMLSVKFTGVVFNWQKLTHAELGSPALLRWMGGGYPPV